MCRVLCVVCSAVCSAGCSAVCSAGGYPGVSGRSSQKCFTNERRFSCATHRLSSTQHAARNAPVPGGPTTQLNAPCSPSRASYSATVAGCWQRNNGCWQRVGRQRTCCDLFRVAWPGLALSAGSHAQSPFVWPLLCTTAAASDGCNLGRLDSVWQLTTTTTLSSANSHHHTQQRQQPPPHSAAPTATTTLSSANSHHHTQQHQQPRATLSIVFESQRQNLKTPAVVMARCLHCSAAAAFCASVLSLGAPL